MAVIAFDGVVLADLAGPCEILRRVRGENGRNLYSVAICSDSPVVATEGLELSVPHRLRYLASADTILIPGIDDLDRAIPPRLTRAISRAIKRGKRVASICSGAFVLAGTGQLSGLRATTHWMTCGELSRRHPDIVVDPNVLYVDNGQLLTSAGAAAGLDLCLYLIRRDFGADVAAAAARAAVMPLERNGGQAQFIVHAPPVPEGTSMSELLAWLEANLRRDLSIAAIARRAGMSPRTLSRRFPEQVGTTPAQWIAAARVREAQRLLEATDASIERVASQVGFKSTAVMREHFNNIVGTSPHEYRRNFGRTAA